LVDHIEGGHRVRVLEKRVLRRKLGNKREEATEG
jgi:hypothetical protein